MIVAGVDIGSLTGKAVIMAEGSIKSSGIVLSKPIPQETAKLVMSETLDKANLKMEDIDYIVGTGYGRMKVPFANTDVSEISCHTKGAVWLVPTVRTIVDIGGQDCKAISVNEKGDVRDFVMNDKCAAGTGRFLEVAARVLGLTLDELGPEAFKATKPSAISSQCCIFAESEIISYLAENRSIPDLAAGLIRSVVVRIISMVKKVGFKKDLTMTGGVAKNPAIVKFLEVEFGEIMRMPIDPQLVGAVGAALFAGERLLKESNRISEVIK